MGIDRDFARAFAKAQLGAGTILPMRGKLFVSVKDTDKPVVLPAVRQLVDLGFTIVATDGTARYLASEGVAVERVNKVAQGRPHIVDRVVDGDIALIFNTTEGWQSLKDSESIRRAGLMNKVPQFTTASASVASVQAIAALRDNDLEVRPLQSYHLRLAS
jgi:carbamoyl-phosphate synthase large subunit